MLNVECCLSVIAANYILHFQHSTLPKGLYTVESRQCRDVAVKPRAKNQRPSVAPQSIRAVLKKRRRRYEKYHKRGWIAERRIAADLTIE